MKVLLARGLSLESFKRYNYKNLDELSADELLKEREESRKMQVACGGAAAICDVAAVAASVHPVLKAGAGITCSAIGAYCILRVEDYVWEINRRIERAEEVEKEKAEREKKQKEEAERERLEREKKVGGEATGPRVGIRGSELGGSPARDNRRRGHGGIRPDSERDTMMVNPF